MLHHQKYIDKARIHKLILHLVLARYIKRRNIGSLEH